jgi:hypothetical protein
VVQINPVVNAADAIFVKLFGRGLTLPLHIKMELGPFWPVCVSASTNGTRRFSRDAWGKTRIESWGTGLAIQDLIYLCVNFPASMCNFDGSQYFSGVSIPI